MQFRFLSLFKNQLFVAPVYHTAFAFSVFLFSDAGVLVCTKLCNYYQLAAGSTCIFADTCFAVSVKQRL